MSMPFRLSLPADHRFRGLLLEVTAKCAELSGGSASDGQTLAEALSSTVNAMALDPTADVLLVFRPGRGGVEVTATSGGRTATVHQAIPVSKS